MDEARDDVLAEHVARELVAEVLSGPAVLLLVRAVDAFEEVRHPADAALREADLQARETGAGRRPDDVGGDLHDVHGHERERDVDGDSSDVIGISRRRADVETDDRALVRARGPERVPPLVVQARQARLLRVLRERERVAALRGHAPDLGDHRVLVPDRRDRERDEPARVRAAPLVDVPVVVRLQHGQRASSLVGAAGANSDRRSPGTTGSTSSRAHRSRSCRARGRRSRSSRRRISPNDMGFMPYSSGGRPATAFRPKLAPSLVAPCHTSAPFGARTTRGARSRQRSGRWRSNRSRGSTTWSSTLTRTRSSMCMPAPIVTSSRSRRLCRPASRGGGSARARSAGPRSWRR